MNLWKHKEIFLSFPKSENSEFIRVFLQTVKFELKGTLRYTFNKEEAGKGGKYRNSFKNLMAIDIL